MGRKVQEGMGRKVQEGTGRKVQEGTGRKVDESRRMDVTCARKGGGVLAFMYYEFRLQNLLSSMLFRQLRDCWGIWK